MCVCEYMRAYMYAYVWVVVLLLLQIKPRTLCLPSSCPTTREPHSQHLWTLAGLESWATSFISFLFVYGRDLFRKIIVYRLCDFG